MLNLQHIVLPDLHHHSQHVHIMFSCEVPVHHLLPVSVPSAVLWQQQHVLALHPSLLQLFILYCLPDLCYRVLLGYHTEMREYLQQYIVYWA